MSQTSMAGPMHIDIPVPMLLRTMFVAMGLFVITIATWELYGGVWPLNIGSPFFFFLIAGAWSVGVPITMAGLFGWAAHWTIEKGRIHLRKRNPFGTEDRVLHAAEVADFEIVEREAMEGPNTWMVMVVTRSGEKLPTYDVQSRSAAERVRSEMLAAFSG